MFIKNKKDLPEDNIVILNYKFLVDRFGYTIRITRFWEMLPLTFGLEKFELLDYNDYNFCFFENYLIDKSIEWRDGNDIDFSEIANKIFDIGNFTASEKILLKDGTPFNLEKRIWAIFLAVFYSDQATLLNNEDKND